MKLLNLLNEFEQEFSKEYKIYLDLHKDLDTWRGKELSDEDLLKVNPILSAIQDQYIALHASFYFITQRNELSLKAMKGYQQFIDDIKGGGAQPTKKEDAEA
jgi:hypothetical protein